jgi:hypothetical protein
MILIVLIDIFSSFTTIFDPRNLILKLKKLIKIQKLI